MNIMHIKIVVCKQSIIYRMIKRVIIIELFSKDSIQGVSKQSRTFGDIRFVKRKTHRRVC